RRRRICRRREGHRARVAAQVDVAEERVGGGAPQPTDVAVGHVEPLGTRRPS
ncbi:MAG: hypothetical protein GY847_22930, partial [Proteobacteria bacterium]|nr:hypothetical protein [Pseudomonadota bacterium]